MMISAEDAMAGTATRAELECAIDAVLAIRPTAVPTLAVVGQYDPLMYDTSVEADASQRIERVAALTTPNFEYRMVADTGHGLNLHYSGHETFELTHDWLPEQRH
jgi:hypothetical protein